MTPSERLKKIEEEYEDGWCPHPKYILDDIRWLITRVKRLTEALEFYSNVTDPGEMEGDCSWNERFKMIKPGNKARKALEEK
jgi:hypothetical protein